MSVKRGGRLKPAFKVWIELDGRAVLGDGKARILEAIDKSGSLAAGAESLDMSYRGLWGRLRDMEKRLGDALVVRRTGGCGGGGSQLTPEARTLLRKYRRFRDGIEKLVNRRFESVFGRRPARGWRGDYFQLSLDWLRRRRYALAYRTLARVPLSWKEAKCSSGSVRILLGLVLGRALVRRGRRSR